MRCVLLAAVLVASGSLGCGTGIPGLDPSVEVVVVADVNPPPPTDDGLESDKLEDKKPTFDPALVDRRPLEGWLVNQSDAVIRLDVPLVRPDEDGDLLALRPSYAAAMKAAQKGRASTDVLPSVNLIAGKAKQFDDGLYAALDQAFFLGHASALPSHLDLVERLLKETDFSGEAAGYLAAGLTLGGRETHLKDSAIRDRWIAEFQNNPAISKPIGFYTWNDTLKHCWAFMRFFQQPLPDNHMVVIELVRILEQDAALAADCRRAARFYGQLTNPLARLTIADLAGSDLTSKQALARLRAEKGVKLGGSALFPPSTSRENELFARLFPRGTPTGSNLMKELVLAIRSGKVDLTPRPESGWYDHQVYALETLLMPERGEERHKLLLTKPYKKRMLEAFQALITTRRETHARELFGETTASVKVPDEFAPRLRLEPCPSYYLRTARSYDFLHDFLTTEVGPTALKELHGLHSDGERGRDLLTELEWMRQLFYGFYLVSCDDIGLAPQLAEGEAGNELDRVACYASAEEWLRQVADELDLAEDTRVAIPIYVDPARGTSRLWVTLGVRLTKLQADYVKPPRIKPAEGEGDWQVVEGWQLAPSNYLIAVDEFAEVEARALEPPNRE